MSLHETKGSEKVVQIKEPGMINEICNMRSRMLDWMEWDIAMGVPESGSDVTKDK
jgi:hypothetical protein